MDAFESKTWPEKAILLSLFVNISILVGLLWFGLVSVIVYCHIYYFF